MIPASHTVRYRHLRRVPVATVSEGGDLRVDIKLYTIGEIRRRVLPNPLPTGGRTLAQIVDADGNVVSSAEVMCSVGDNYCKRVGRDIARGRAVKRLAAGGSDA